MKKLLTFVKPVIRGAIKSIPFGNTALEIGTSIKEAVQNKNDINQVTPTHDWKSIITQLAVVGFIVYAFATHMITLDQVFGYLGLK
jgi:hypothetical protein